MNYNRHCLVDELIHNQLGSEFFTGEDLSKLLLSERIAANQFEVEHIGSQLILCGRILAQESNPSAFECSTSHYYRYNSSATAPDDQVRRSDRLYDLIIIGGGYAGIAGATRARSLGLDLALIYEPHDQYHRVIQLLRDRAATASKQMHDSDERVDPKQLTSHDINLEQLRQIGCDLYPGSATFSSMNTVNVGSIQLRFRKAMIATGATRTGSLLNQIDVCLTQCSEKDVILILGSSRCIRSIEISNLLSRICYRVILLYEDNMVITGLDPVYTEYFEALLQRSHVHIIFVSKFIRVSDSETHPERVDIRALFLDENGDRRSVQGTYIIDLRENRPNVANLNLDQAGVKCSPSGAIQVDDFYFTSNKNICAVGDCITTRLYRSWQLAQFQGHNAVTNSFIRLRRFSNVSIPIVIQTLPKVAHLVSVVQLVSDTDLDLERFREPINGGFLEVAVDAGSGSLISAFAIGDHADLLIMTLASLLPKSTNLSRLALIAPIDTSSSICNIARRIQSSRYSPYRFIFRRIYRKLIRIIY